MTGDNLNIDCLNSLFKRLTAVILTTVHSHKYVLLAGAGVSPVRQKAGGYGWGLWPLGHAKPAGHRPHSAAIAEAMREARPPPFPAKQGLGLLDAVDQLARLVPGHLGAQLPARQLESGPSRLCRGILGVGV